MGGGAATFGMHPWVKWAACFTVGVAGTAVVMLNLRTDLAHPDSGLSPGEEAGACAWVSGMGSCGVCRGIQGPVAPSPGLESRAHLGNPEIQEVKWV